jgi:hypothetical protein
MRIVEPGHLYLVKNIDGPGEQEIRFVRRRDERALLLDEFKPGILSQELLRVLIDRTRYLNDEDPCAEDVEIIHKLRDCLRLFEARAARRTIEKLPMPETASACPRCHHILCSCAHPDRLVHEVRR